MHRNRLEERLQSEPSVHPTIFVEENVRHTEASNFRLTDPRQNPGRTLAET